MIKKEGRFKYLEIKNISKNFGETFVLKNIHLDVFKGEFLCLLGPSGWKNNSAKNNFWLRETNKW